MVSLFPPWFPTAHLIQLTRSSSSGLTFSSPLPLCLVRLPLHSYRISTLEPSPLLPLAFTTTDLPLALHNATRSLPSSLPLPCQATTNPLHQLTIPLHLLLLVLERVWIAREAANLSRGRDLMVVCPLRPRRLRHSSSHPTKRMRRMRRSQTH
jgi:hypothetical protein